MGSLLRLRGLRLLLSLNALLSSKPSSRTGVCAVSQDFALAYVYARETRADADIANVLTMDEARC